MRDEMRTRSAEVDSQVLSNSSACSLQARPVMNRLAAAIAQKKPFVHALLAAPCVPTEVIVIVQNQNACLGIAPAKVMG